jgi:hypothetical protein
MKPRLIKLEDLHKAARWGEIEGANDLALAMSWIIRCTPQGDQLSHEEVFARGRDLYRRLTAGEAVPEQPTGLPDLSKLPGTNDVEKARSFLETSLPDWDQLSDAKKDAAARELLASIAAAGAGSIDDGEEDEDEQKLSASALAIKRLDARDPSFRTLSNEQRCFGTRTLAEADRIRRLRAARAAGAQEQRLLADAGSVAPPLPKTAPTPTRNLPTLSELRRYPPARGVQSDLARMVTWITENQPSYALHDWETQISMAQPLLRDVLAREQRSVAGGAR